MSKSIQGDFVVESVARRIAGDIAFSEEPGKRLKWWREEFGVSQVEVARLMGVSPSVVTDYEKGRRAPGSKFIRKFVIALLEYDKSRGWEKLKELARLMGIPAGAIIDMADFDEPVSIVELVDLVEGKLLTPLDQSKIQVYGYTVVDSIRAIMSLSGIQFYALMGGTPQRCIVFTGVRYGRSPMVAVRVSPVKPGAIVIHGPRDDVDPLAVEISKLEGIPLILSLAESVERLVSRLRARAARVNLFSPEV